MKKRVAKMKGFFAEFKKFITRGNVLDLAVGVIVGGAFTGIVNGLSDYILKPIINYLLSLILGGKGLSGAVVYLQKVFVEGSTTEIDLAKSIYLDFGSFASAIINFLLVAFTLFMVIRTINKIHEAQERVIAGMELKKKKEIAKIRYEEKVKKTQAKKIYEERLAAAQAAKKEEERLAKEKEAAEKAAAEEKATANTRLLEEIRDLLKERK